jgi:hypothetical protein
MSGHSGRCFRAWRRTKARKTRQGQPWERPIRQKVPLALRPFLTMALGGSNQRHAGADAMASAISRYAQHQTMIGAPRRGGARGQ